MSLFGTLRLSFSAADLVPPSQDEHCQRDCPQEFAAAAMYPSELAGRHTLPVQVHPLLDCHLESEHLHCGMQQHTQFLGIAQMPLPQNKAPSRNNPGLWGLRVCLALSLLDHT